MIIMLIIIVLILIVILVVIILIIIISIIHIRTLLLLITDASTLRGMEPTSVQFGTRAVLSAPVCLPRLSAYFMSS